jgi:hypothetical protein
MMMNIREKKRLNLLIAKQQTNSNQPITVGVEGGGGELLILYMIFPSS